MDQADEFVVKLNTAFQNEQIENLTIEIQKTEGIQNFPGSGESFDDAPIFPLIEEKAGFLSAQNVGFEA